MIIIKPLDTFFFRDGRPFTSGEESWCYQIFPPHPTTIYGAMRSYYISARDGLEAFLRGDMRDTIGTVSESGGFGIKGIFISNETNIFVKAPLDTVIVEEKRKSLLCPLRLEEKNGRGIDNLSTSYRLMLDRRNWVATPTDALVDDIVLKEYLKGEIETMGFVKQSELYVSEPKVGIGRCRETHTTEKGKLYQVPMIRLKENICLAVIFYGLKDFPKEGLIKIGGEGKSAKYTTTNDRLTMDALADELEASLNQGSIFKLYLATPAIFRGGWLPEGVDRQTMKWKIGECLIELLVAAVGSYQHIGGWDLARNRPKVMYRAVPAGSVYYFKIIEGTGKELIKSFHGRNISEIYPEQGLGLTYIGMMP